MTVTDFEISGLLLFEPRVFEDDRGTFLEVFHAERYREYGLEAPFVQDNLSCSQRGVIRGLHFQRRHPQGKLVSAVRGTVHDVAVDLRLGSKTFGRHAAIELSDQNRRQLWVPPGFAHGFAALTDGATVLYKCTDVYHPDDEGGLRWNDPALGIEWPVDEPVLSARDLRHPVLADLAVEALPTAEPA